MAITSRHAPVDRMTTGRRVTATTDPLLVQKDAASTVLRLVGELAIATIVHPEKEITDRRVAMTSLVVIMEFLAVHHQPARTAPRQAVPVLEGFRLNLTGICVSRATVEH